jgi:hypothetical protein
MTNSGYTFSSPKVRNFLNLPDLKSDDYFNNILALRERFKTDPEVYKKALDEIGVFDSDLNAINKYTFFQPGWDEGTTVDRINRAAELAHTLPDPAYAYSTSESPLYRGAKVDPSTIPAIGNQFSFDRFQSFTPDILTAARFTKGNLPFDPNNFGAHRNTDPNLRQTLFKIEQDPSGKFNYLKTPGSSETEVLSRPRAQFVVEDKKVFPFNEKDLYGDVNLIKLRQIYGVDPIGAAAQGVVQGIRRNPAGVAGGAAMTFLNDEIAKAISKDDYKTAAAESAKDVALGAAAETGLKQVAAPLARRVAPAAAARVAPYVAGAARVGIPAAVGTGLFMQGKTGSALDTLTNKAATVVPGLRSNPQTDVGRRAGKAISNEAKYLLNSVLQNRVPYLGGRLF